jgi:hypothetical protein
MKNECRPRIPIDITNLSILFYIHERRPAIGIIRLQRYEIKKISSFRPKGVISGPPEANTL